jgi:hypothetical protein
MATSITNKTKSDLELKMSEATSFKKLAEIWFFPRI